MNPIVYNKNGQFRFTDFIGYLPEFLRSEPDVVTFLQVMSDYINNAYRNVEVTDEFELVKVCTSTDSKRVMRWMETLCQMFKLACDRGDKVLYMSVPRNNVKSNVILGNANAEYVRTIEVEIEDIQDSFSSASSRLGGTSAVEDGDVVYVKYRKMSPVMTVAYYYVKDGDILVKDTMGTSQDPFTGTYNDPSSAIEFSVTDVGNVIKRYGGTHGGTVYYEVYFSLKISDIGHTPATGYAEYDVDGDSIDNIIYVDYYNLGNATANSFNAYIRFAGTSSFGWTGNFPGGMFYFRDSSSAGLTNLDTKGTMSIADTMQSPSVEKYRINDIDKVSGEYKIYTDVFPGIYSNALFYVMRGSESLGVYRMNGDITEDSRFDEGKPYIRVVNMSGVDYEIEKDTREKNLMLVAVPLAYSKYTLDYDSRLPLIKWDTEYTGFNDIEIGMSCDTKMVGATLDTNTAIYDGPIVRKTANSILLAGDMSKVIRAKTTYMWYNGTDMQLVEVDRVHSEYAYGYTQIDVRKPITGDTAVIYEITTGYLWANDDLDSSGRIAYFNTTLNKSYYTPSIGDLLLINVDEIVHGNNSEETITNATRVCKVALYDDVSGVIGIEKPAEKTVRVSTYTPIVRIVSNDAQVYEFLYIKKVENGATIGVANERSYGGSIFTQRHMLATSTGGKEYSLLDMITDVKEPIPGAVFEKGDYVYSESDDTIYKIGKSVVLGENGKVSVDPTAIPDYMVHYSLSYKKVVNDYMPYSGPVASLDYEELPNYDGDMSIVRLPLYIKKVNDVRLKYGWEQRQYVYYKDSIGVETLDRSGFIEIYSGNDNSPVDVDLTAGANELVEPAMLSGCGSRYYVVDVDKDLTAVRNTDGTWTVTVRSAGHGLPDGALITATVDGGVADVFATKNADGETVPVPVKVISADIIQYNTIYTENYGNVEMASSESVHIVHDRSYAGTESYPVEGDIVRSGDKVYIVGAGEWKCVDKNAIVTPSVIYARQNLFDESVTNPTFAMGNDDVIKNIVVKPDEPGVAELQLSQRIIDLDRNPSAYDGKGRVYISYVNQGVFNGWHTIKKVHNAGLIDIYIDPSIEVTGPIMPIVNRKMTLNLGKWYKYTLEGYEWDKISENASYVTSNTMVSKDIENNRITTKYAHGMKAGDHVLLDLSESGDAVYHISADNMDLAKIRSTMVVGVIDDHTIELADAVVGPNDNFVSIFKGYIVDDRNLVKLANEYSTVLDGKTVRFTNGDIVITIGQVCLDEIRAWRVVSNTAWVPMKKKRTIKVDRMSIDMERNPAYELDDLENEVEYSYTTYSDAEVLADLGALRIDYANARNYHFEHPYMENLDTTQNVDLEYSSKYDYATVAPRNDMDPTFKGVPDMDYPLAERIERLAYLRDPDVIDIDLIGYLARFMGYDITALADDIRSSNIYRNGDEREKAIRETVAHLPQFYALNGTKPGINMLMATFGLVGDLVTMWTNTADPYGRLVRQDEVPDQINKDASSSWVPTPHVTLDVISNDVYNSMLMGEDELLRMKEQIRRYKPINVVFDGIRVIFESTVRAQASLSFAGYSMTNGSIAMFGVSGETEYGDISRDPCMDDDCSF